ncbi:histone H1-like [Seriola lalandi dorsalis]|uniref:histone H1-like n=1 Tax=Seriola lalandi dorsalis TaxID=1841481 RepID=UPI000C6FACEA|nr:histone H1-like [Seriola lalandi dorsalis]
MRSKATAKKASERIAQGNVSINIKARENTPLRLIKQVGRTTKPPTGKGLGKAGAKRLGRLLKRAIQDQEEPAEKGQVSVPKTPVRLFKHQIQTEADNASKRNTAQTKPASHQVSQLILSVVSHCKHRGGISMAELKQTLAAGGYDVTKNNRRVNVVTKRLVNNVTLVRTTRNASLRLNTKKKPDTTRVRTSPVKSPKPKGDLRQSKAVSKSPKGAEKSQKQAIKTPKPRGKPHKPKGKTSRRAAKSHKPRVNTRNPAGKSQKLKGKTHKRASRSHKPRKKTPKARKKSQKPAGKKRKPSSNQPSRVRKPARKAQRTRRRQPKRNQHPYKVARKRQRLPKTRARLKTRQRQIARRRAYYY